MWILFSLLCMITLAAANIIGKKAVGADELAPIELRIMVMTVSVVLGILMYIFRLGESDSAPWELIAAHPVTLAAACCTVFSEFLYIFSLKYTGMTIMVAVSSFEGIVIFAGLITINFITGNLGAVQDLFIPVRLIFVLLILICTILLPNIERFAKRNTAINDEQKRERKHIVLGISIALLAVICGCGDSLITDTLLDSGTIGAVDLTMAVYFSQIFLLPVFCFVLAKKCRSGKTSCKIVNRRSVVYAILYAASLFFGTIAVSDDAVRSEVMFLTYPVIAIFGAKIVLKEQYTWRQNLCIWVMTLAAIAFCVIDYMI